MMRILASSFDINDPLLWFNRGLQYGDGLFETMRFEKGKVPLWRLHTNRMVNGLQRLGIDEPDFTVINQAINQIEDTPQLAGLVLKLTVFRGHQLRGYQPHTRNNEWLLTATPKPECRKSGAMVLGVAQNRLADIPLLSGMKHLNRLEQVLLSEELSQQQHCDDLLVLDTKDRVVETTFQNIVLIKNNTLFTPKINQCGVHGVAIEWLKNNFNVESIHITFEKIREYDSMMVCNSVRGFQAVACIDQCHSFCTNQEIQDRIITCWENLFN